MLKDIGQKIVIETLAEAEREDGFELADVRSGFIFIVSDDFRPWVFTAIIRVATARELIGKPCRADAVKEVVKFDGAVFQLAERGGGLVAALPVDVILIIGHEALKGLGSFGHDRV